MYYVEVHSVDQLLRVTTDGTEPKDNYGMVVDRGSRVVFGPLGYRGIVRIAPASQKDDRWTEQ